eukprot:g44442.t1
MWCNDNNLSLNIGKAKELIIDFRKKGGEHAPISINGTEVERVKSIQFFGVTITDDLSWTSHDHKKLQKVVCTAQTITEANLPSIDPIYMARCRRKAANIIKDPSHPGNDLLQPLPSGRRCRNLNTHMSKFRNNFFLSIIRV